MTDQPGEVAHETIIVTDNGVAVSNIEIGPGLINRLAELLPDAEGRRRVGVLSQPSIRGLAANARAGLLERGYETEMIELPDREAAKTLEVLGHVAGRLNQFGMTRHDLVIGIGGGAATDLAGFVAAVYLRGVECVLVPTTLLAAVDAVIGGKTAVNVGGKNLVGAFHHPSTVIVDLDVLSALPEPILREGSAEVVKAGFIADPGLVHLYETHGLDADLGEVVRRAIAVKARVVSADFTERGRRTTLNYGHTIGHAIEIESGWPHGHSVAVGMVAAATVSESLSGFTERGRHDAVIERLGLPTRVAGLDGDELARLIALDKKRDADGLRMVLLTEIGATTVAHVDPATVTAALAAVGVA